MHRLLLLPLLVSLTACGGEEPPSVAPEEGGSAEQDASAETVAADAVAMQDAATAEEATAPDADADGTEGPGSLRDRITVTPPPEVVENPFYSTAVTLEERKANVKRALEQAGKTGDVKIDIHDLGGWEFDERKEQPFPEFVLALEGRTIVVRGFMMPDIDFEHIRKFHLVRSLWGCCFGAPPRINEILRVVLADEGGMDYTYNTLEIRGTFHTAFEMVDGMIEDVYRLQDATVKVRAYEDPQAPTDFDATTGFEGVIPGAEEY